MFNMYERQLRELLRIDYDMNPLLRLSEFKKAIMILRRTFSDLNRLQFSQVFELSVDDVTESMRRYFDQAHAACRQAITDGDLQQLHVLDQLNALTLSPDYEAYIAIANPNKFNSWCRC